MQQYRNLKKTAALSSRPYRWQTGSLKFFYHWLLAGLSSPVFAIRGYRIQPLRHYSPYVQYEREHPFLTGAWCKYAHLFRQPVHLIPCSAFFPQRRPFQIIMNKFKKFVK